MSTEERPGVDDPNDQELDSLLRQALQPESARSIGGPTPDCIEAETVAAWSEGVLPREEARAVEAHAARCSRCQAMLAAFARSAPVTEAVRPPALADEAPEVNVWRWWRAGWLVPAAATAAALAIWVATPSRSVPETSKDVALQAKPAPMESTGVVPEAAFRRGAEQTPDAPGPPAAAAAPVPPERRAARAAEKAGPATEVDGLRQRAAASEVSSEVAASANAAPSVAPSPSAGLMAQGTLPREVPAPSVADAAPALADKRAASPIPPPSPVGLARAAGPGTTRTVVEVASGDLLRWRIRQGATMRVEFSDSGGREWAAAAVPEGESSAVVAGVAAGGRVCWLVGRQGMVLLTTDGVSFQRVPFPDSVDLTFVSAGDARRATVRTVDGRTFTTADGGATWVAARP